MRNIQLLITVFFCLLFPFYSGALTITINNGNNTFNWSSIKTINNNLDPTANDDIIVRGRTTLVVDVGNAVCKSLTLGNGGTNNNGSLTFNASSQLDISGSLVFDAISNQTNTLTMSLGGSLACRAITLVSGTTAAFTPGTGTVVLKATNTLPSTVFTTFNNLDIESGTTSLATPITVKNLTITSGGTLSQGVHLIALSGNLSNAGSIVSGSGGLTMAGTAAQTIGTFTTTGTLTMAKTGSTATLTGNMNAGALTINIAGGTLNLGSGLTHTITGSFTMSNGTLNGGSSILQLQSTSSATGGTFTASTGTVSFNGSANQTLPNLSFANVTLAGSGTKTFPSNASLISGKLSIEGSAVALLVNATTYTVGSLFLGGVGRNSGTWGGTGSGASNINTIYFTATTNGRVQVTADSRPALTITATGPTKTYGTALSSGTSSSTFSVSGSLTSGESVTSVTLTPDAAGLSASTAAGNAYVVVPSLATGTGGFLAANYIITYVSYNGTVAKKALTVSGAAAASKVYDGLTDATVSGSLNGVVGSDNVILNGTGTFASATVGANKSINTNYSISGTASGNYSLTQPGVLTANIYGYYNYVGTPDATRSAASISLVPTNLYPASIPNIPSSASYFTDPNDGIRKIELLIDGGAIAVSKIVADIDLNEVISTSANGGLDVELISGTDYQLSALSSTVSRLVIHSTKLKNAATTFNMFIQLNMNGTISTHLFQLNAAALPVHLTSFTAKVTPENKVSLGWVTGSESQNKGFRIERQVQNGKFEQIGFVASKAQGGNSATSLYYSFIDQSPVNGTSFYRLVQEDLDGKKAPSEVRVIKLNGQSVAMAYPNPTTGNFTISRTSDGKKMNIQVYDMNGRMVKQINQVTETNYKMTISQSGVYSIKLIYPETGEQSIQRIVVQK